MQSLGLSNEPTRSDGWLKSIFWPSVDNAWDVDYLGTQGFWVCFAIAVLTFGITLLTVNPLLIIIGFFGALIYWIGGMGVREKNWIAASIIFFIYLLDTVYTFAMGSGYIFLRILILAVLFSNIRATFLASEWKQPLDNEDKPSRFNETLKDKLVDQWPPKLWKVLQIPFYVFALLWIVLNILGIAAVVIRHFQQAMHA